MAIRGFNIGGMLAQGGMNQGQQIASGFTQFGEGLSKLGTGIATGMEKRSDKQEIEKLLAQHANDPAKLNALGVQAAAEGKEELSTALLQAAKLATTRVGEEALAARKQAIAIRAEGLGLPSVAESARSAIDNNALDDIAKDLRGIEIKKLPSQTTNQRAARASQAGISQAEFAEAGLADATDDFFESYVTGNEGKTEAWADADGNIGAYRFNKAGKVWSETVNKFVEPSELGLVQKAPQVQKVIDISSKLASSLQESNAEDIIQQRDNARGAVASINRLDRQLGRVGGMPTGIAANIEVKLKQVGALIGLPFEYESLVNSQTYMVEAANFVKEQIKAFGTGNGISDKDLKFTEKMVGADITLQAEALEKILRLYREAAVNTVNSYNTLVTETGKQLSEEDMIGFQPLEIPAEDQPELSSDALKYLKPKTGG